jgi:hypothetical protein
MSLFKKKITSAEDLRCSFCNKPQREVKKLVAGPTVYICNECVAICLDIISEVPPATGETIVWPENAAANCTLCRMPMFVAEGVYVKDRGLFCAECVAAIEGALAKKERR